MPYDSDISGSLNMGKRKALRFMLAALAAALLAGCGSVSTSRPLPQAKLSTDEQARFAGTWVLQLDGGKAYTIGFDCAGVAHVATIQWEDGHFRLEQGAVVIAKGKHSDTNSGFFSIPAEDKGKPTVYPFGRYAFVSPTNLVIWWPDPTPFQAAVKAGRLKGTVSKDGQLVISAALTATPQEVLDFLDDPANPPLFDYDKPYLFTKVAGASGRQAGCGK